MLDGVSVQLDAPELDHIAPLLGFCRYEFRELSRCHRQGLDAQFASAHLEIRRGDDGIDLFVSFPPGALPGKMALSAHCTASALIHAS